METQSNEQQKTTEPSPVQQTQAPPQPEAPLPAQEEPKVDPQPQAVVEAKPEEVQKVPDSNPVEQISGSEAPTQQPEVQAKPEPEPAKQESAQAVQSVQPVQPVQSTPAPQSSVTPSDPAPAAKVVEESGAPAANPTSVPQVSPIENSSNKVEDSQRVDIGQPSVNNAQKVATNSGSGVVGSDQTNINSAPPKIDSAQPIIDSAQPNINSAQPNVDIGRTNANSSVVSQPSLNNSANSAITIDHIKQPLPHSAPGHYEETKTSYSQPLPPGPPADHLKLFVGGLYYQEENDINDYFVQFGEVVQAQLLRHKQTGRSRGFAFVTMVDPDGAVKKAVLSKRHEIKGQYVDVKPAEDGKTRERVEQNTAKLFVGGIEGTVSTEELRDFFQNYGPIKEAVVLKNINTNVSRGFGFVTFEDRNLADDIVRENNCVLKGKRMDVKWAEPKDSASQQRSSHTYSRGGHQSSHGGYRDDYNSHRGGGYHNHHHPPPMDPPVATIAPYGPPPVQKPSYNEPYYQDNRGGVSMDHYGGGGAPPAPHYSNQRHSNYKQDSYYDQPAPQQPYKPQTYQEPSSGKVHDYRQPDNYQSQPNNNYYMPQKDNRYGGNSYGGGNGGGASHYNSGSQGGYQDYQGGSQHVPSTSHSYMPNQPDPKMESGGRSGHYSSYNTKNRYKPY